MGILSTADLAPAGGHGRRIQCVAGTNGRVVSSATDRSPCGEWYSAAGDGQGIWHYDDGLHAFATVCKACARTLAETFDARSHVEALRDWISTAVPPNQREALLAYADDLARPRRPVPFPAPGHAAFRAWRESHASSGARSASQSASAADDATMPSTPSEPQTPRERVGRRRRSDVPNEGGST